MSRGALALLEFQNESALLTLTGIRASETIGSGS